MRVGTSTATRDVKRLTRLLGDKIETVEPGFGIETMRLAATLAEPLNPKQTISSLAEEPEADVAGLIDGAGQPCRRGSRLPLRGGGERRARAGRGEGSRGCPRGG